MSDSVKGGESSKPTGSSGRLHSHSHPDPNHVHSNGCCQTIPVAMQSLSEVDFDRGLWGAIVKGDFSRFSTLLSQGKDPNALDETGYSPLHYSARSGRLDMCERLISRGAKVNCQTPNGGATPLHRAAYMGHEKVISFLLEKGGDPNIQDFDGKTPLHKAYESGNKNAIDTLLKVGANPEIKDNREKTPPEYIK
eukprot:TRINITY_DN302_c0_g1_i1.p1 TRINITY_DN302_c0_g1~~TRINITY_DN302_c0_g1_i1.p1  ORF type:complete len:194 (+),score=24.59 TRINITY_DN302_c0_g1_i1:165-746(+)